MFGDQGHRLGGGGGGYNRAPGYGAEGCDCDLLNGSHNAALVGSLGCLLLIGVGAVMSLAAVPPLHLAIRYNSFTKAADTHTVYEPGRYLIGPFNKFLLFPSTVQTVEFADEIRLSQAGIRYEPLHTRTKDGLGLHLQVALQYKLPKETLGKLYNEFNLNYEPVITSSVRDTLIRAASEYEATKLWEERKVFGDTMQSMVDKELRHAYAQCWGLQLMLIDLPDVFEHRIVETQIQKQQMLIKEREQQSTQIRAETTVVQAEFARKVRVIRAEGQANFTLITKKAQAQATKNKIDIESQVLGSIRNQLDMGPDGLVQYQKWTSIEDLDSADLVFGFAGSSQVLLGPKL